MPSKSSPTEQEVRRSLDNLANYPMEPLEFAIELAAKADMSPMDLLDVSRDSDYFAFIQSSDEEYIDTISEIIDDFYVQHGLRIDAVFVPSVEKHPKVTIIDLSELFPFSRK